MIRARAITLLAAVAAATSAAHAAPHGRAVPLPGLPIVSRVRIEAARDHVVVIHEIALPRGDWSSGDFELYVAFGAPGAPRAFDAHLIAVADGAIEANDTEGGESLVTERAARRPPTAAALLGPPQMAGEIVRIRDASFRRATESSRTAILRLRTLLTPLPAPGADTDEGREILVRLGSIAGPGCVGCSPGMPLTLGRVELVSLEPRPFVTRAEARLCGPDADPYPLAVGVSPPPAVAPRRAIPPVLAVRHATDDLCVRFWTQN